MAYSYLNKQRFIKSLLSCKYVNPLQRSYLNTGGFFLLAMDKSGHIEIYLLWHSVKSTIRKVFTSRDRYIWNFRLSSPQPFYVILLGIYAPVSIRRSLLVPCYPAARTWLGICDSSSTAAKQRTGNNYWTQTFYNRPLLVSIVVIYTLTLFNP